jgi:hypothetical protein
MPRLTEITTYDDVMRSFSWATSGKSIGNSNGLLHRQSVPWAPRGAGSQPQSRMRSCGWTTDLGPPSSDCGAQLRSGGTAVIGGGVQ